MKHLRLAGLLIILVAGLLVSNVLALDPPHDTVSCALCHNSGKLNNTNSGINISALCLDCHRAGGKGSVVGNKPANPYGSANQVIVQGIGTEHGFMGSDMHTRAKATKRPSKTVFAGAYVTGMMTCVSCHNPHNQTVAGQTGNKFLRVAMGNTDALCMECHDDAMFATSTGGTSHPLTTANYMASLASGSYFSRPRYTALSSVYVEKGNKVTCLVCHKPHNATYSTPTSTTLNGSGYIGRMYTDNWLCAQCHKKHIHGNSYGSPSAKCVDCHSMHNPGGNIKLVADTINGKTISFTNDIAGGNFYTLTEGQPGICQVCHTKTSYYRNYSVNKYSILPGHNTSTACTDCHQHTDDPTFVAPGLAQNPNFQLLAFGADCSGCHGNSSTGNPLPDQVSKKIYPNRSGSHAKHANAYGGGGSCKYCHPNPLPNKHDAYSTSGTYPPSKRAIVEVKTAALGADISYTFNASYGQGRCVNAYCHGGATGAKTFNWNSNPALNCSSCHATPPTTGLHAAHWVNGNADRTDCGQCHPNAESYTTGRAVASHVDGGVDVGAGGISKITSFDGSKNCTSSCHATVNWTTGTPATLGCAGCHGNAPATYAHADHNTTWSIGCTACHLVIDPTPPGTYPFKHITSIYGANDGDTLYKRAQGYATSLKTGRVTDKLYNNNVNSWNGTTCATRLCHNPSPAGTKFANWTSVTAATCTTCHENASIATSAHQAHLTASTVFGKTITCTACHPNNASNGHFMSGGVPAGKVSVGSTGTVLFVYSSPTAGSKKLPLPNKPNAFCSANACHSDGTKSAAPYTAYSTKIRWDVARATTFATGGSCDICHKYQPTTGSHLDHYSSSTASTENRIGPRLNVTTTTGCYRCHTNTNTSSHIDGTKDFKDNGAALGATSVCNACHGGASSSTVAKTNWPTRTDLACDTCHNVSNPGYSKYSTTLSGAIYASGFQRWSTLGHGRKTAKGAYPVSGNPAANQTSCTNCHGYLTWASAGSNHISHQNDDFTRLIKDTATNQCNNCHASPYLYPGKTGYSTTSGIQTHKGTVRFTGTMTKQCGDCHEVHGGSVTKPVYWMYTTNRQMIRATNRPAAGPFTTYSAKVVFTARTGNNSFDDLAANGNNKNNICATCHRNTYHNSLSKDGKHGSSNNGTDYDGQNCTSCHSHKTSFKPSGSCSGCHNTANADGAPRAKMEAYSGAYGAHSIHLDNLKGAQAMTCDDCHGAGASTGTHAGHTMSNPPIRANLTMSVSTGFNYKSKVAAYVNNGSPRNSYCNNINCHFGNTPIWKCVPY